MTSSWGHVKTAATALRLTLNINDQETAQDARDKLLKAARVLYEKALGDQMPREIADHVGSGAELVTQAQGKEVVVLKELWPGHRAGGHSMKFIIRNISN